MSLNTGKTKIWAIFNHRSTQAGWMVWGRAFWPESILENKPEPVSSGDQSVSQVPGEAANPRCVWKASVSDITRTVDRNTQLVISWSVTTISARWLTAVLFGQVLVWAPCDASLDFSEVLHNFFYIVLKSYFKKTTEYTSLMFFFLISKTIAGCHYCIYPFTAHTAPNGVYTWSRCMFFVIVGGYQSPYKLHLGTFLPLSNNTIQNPLCQRFAVLFIPFFYLVLDIFEERLIRAEFFLCKLRSESFSPHNFTQLCHCLPAQLVSVSSSDLNRLHRYLLLLVGAALWKRCVPIKLDGSGSLKWNKLNGFVSYLLQWHHFACIMPCFLEFFFYKNISAVPPNTHFWTSDAYFWLWMGVFLHHLGMNCPVS